MPSAARTRPTPWTRREGRTVDNEVLEGGLVKEGGGEDHQGVEPATGLIETLSDEIGGEALL